MSPNNKSTNRGLIELILEHGGSINLPYKKNLPDWFSTGGVSFSELDGEYSVSGGNIHGAITYRTFEEAWTKFEEYLDNTGAIQEYVRIKNPHIMVHGDMDEDELKRLVKNEKARRKRIQNV